MLTCDKERMQEKMEVSAHSNFGHDAQFASYMMPATMKVFGTPSYQKNGNEAYVLYRFYFSNTR